jgi:hypothetical protein
VADSDLQTSLTALLAAWAANLPTIQPAVANAPWLNNKALTFGVPGSAPPPVDPPPSSTTTPTSSTNFLTSDRPVWHAGKAFSLPLVGTSAKPITAATVQSGLSGSEYAIGATPSGTPALTHAAFAVGDDKPVQVQITYGDSTTEIVTIVPRIIAFPSRTIVMPYIVPDNWGQGTITPAAINFNNLDIGIIHSVHYNGTAMGSNATADAAAAIQDSFDGNTAALGRAWATDVAARAHAAGKKLLVAVGGQARTASVVYKCATAQGRANHVADLIALRDAYGFDGVDLNWEGDVQGYTSDQILTFCADVCKRLRAAWPTVIITSPLGGLTNSNSFNNYPANWSYAKGVPAISTHLDYFTMQTYGSNASWTVGLWGQWFIAPQKGGSGPNSGTITDITPPTKYASTYGSHPMDIIYAIRLYRYFGIPSHKTFVGPPGYTQLRGPTVYEPGDDQGTTTVWDEPLWTWFKANIIDQNIGTEIVDPSGECYRHFNPAITINVNGTNKQVSFMSYYGDESYKSLKTMMTAEGISGVIPWHLNALGNQGMAMVESRMNPATDAVPTEFNFTPVANAPVSSWVESADVTIADIAVSIPITVSGGLEWRKNGGAYSSQPGTLANNDVLRVRLQTGATAGSPYVGTANVGPWSKPFQVTTASSGFDPLTAPNIVAVWEPGFANTVFSDFGMSTQAAVDGTAYAIADRRGVHHLKAPIDWPQGATVLKQDSGGFRYLDLSDGQALYTFTGVPGAINSNTRLPTDLVFIAGVSKRANGNNGPLFDWTNQNSVKGPIIEGPGYKTNSGLGGYMNDPYPNSSSDATDIDLSLNPGSWTTGALSVGQKIVYTVVLSATRGKRQVYVNKVLVFEDTHYAAIPDFANTARVQLNKVGYAFGQNPLYCLYAAMASGSFPLSTADWDALHTRAGARMGLTL